jgi:hypothetical protein
MDTIVRRFALPLALAACLTAAMPPVIHPARAAGAPDGTQSDTGVYAAISCGLGLRSLRYFPGLLYVLVPPTLAVCAFMLVDAAMSPD